ncbi:MAG TPA: amidohydrolase family protein [Kofleriaceae bacterium]|nr:amidohydrolase family protein [Kofleriaceae bacterium]
MSVARLRLLLPIALWLSCSAPPRPQAPIEPPATPGADPGASAATPVTPPAPAAAPTPAANQAVTVKRAVVAAMTRPSGSLITTTAPDGTLTMQLVVLVNGRGPKVDTTLRLAPDGTIASLAATGKHEFGTKVDERFTREGQGAAAVARWKSEEEAGERAAAGAAFYVPLASVPVEGLLVQAALKAGGKLPLLPAGTATLEKIGELEVAAGGERRRVTGYAISGLQLGPTFTWMSADGSWFGTANVWRSIVPEGWEPAIPPLIERQEAWKRERDQRIARAHAHRPPSAGLAYTNARVLDVERGRWLPGQTVVVVGDTIKAVGPTGKLAIPAGAEVIDLAGRAIVPGLVDMHAHLDAADGLLAIASGVTTVRDVGIDPDDLDDFKRRFDTGAAVGPHVVRFGFIEGRNEKAAASRVTAETVEEAKAAVDFFVKRGYDGVKIYNSVKPELVPVIAAAAHAKGLQVTGHIPVHMLAHEAVKAGYDGIEHVNMLFLNFFATHETDTRDTTRFTLVGERADALDLKSKPVLEFFELLRTKRTVITPTLTAFEDLFVGEQGKVPPGLEELVARLPVVPQRRFLLGGLPIGSPAQREQYLAAWGKLLAMVKALHEAKITVMIGTDSIGGLMVHHEMELFSRAGIPNATVLQIATLGAARAMRTDGKVGTIAAGRRADLAIIDGDPLADIRAIRAVTSTMRAGVVYPSAPLYEAVGVRPFGAK